MVVNRDDMGGAGGRGGAGNNVFNYMGNSNRDNLSHSYNSDF
jgi:hypothetical protein